MFAQVVDLLVNERTERVRVIVLLLRLLFTLSLTAKFAGVMGIDLHTTDLLTYQAALIRLLDGTVVLCFGLFYFVWYWSYDVVENILTFPALYVAQRFYDLLDQATRGIHPINRKLWFPILRDGLLWFFNMVDIVVIERNTLRPGRQFYKFYDYLRAVDKGKRETDTTQFTLTISLCIQFVVIYSCIDIPLPTIPTVVLIGAYLLVLGLLVSSLMGLVLETLIDTKHGRLLELLRPVDPEYALSKEKRKTSLESGGV